MFIISFTKVYYHLNLLYFNLWYFVLFSFLISSAEGAEGEDSATRYDGIVYDHRLGLAFEGMQEGVTVESLWKVI